MLRPPSSFRARSARFARSASLAVLLSLAARPVPATPLDFVTVGDPIEAELRVLDLLERADGSRVLRPHLHTRPLQWAELIAEGGSRDSLDLERLISVVRVRRRLVLDQKTGGEPWNWEDSRVDARASGRLAEFVPNDDQELDLSAALQGRVDWSERSPLYRDGTGLHVRAAAQLGSWLALGDFVTGQFAGSRAFADPVLANTDVTTLTEESYVAYTESAGFGPWSAQLGRSRWHWGPGDEGSLLLSKTSAPYTGFALRASFRSLRLHLMTLSATIQGSAGEQLAAHRIEWQPVDALRLGLAEAARYQASGWRPLYLTGVIPYSIVQRLDSQDEPDDPDAIRNNVMFAADAAWRIADGTRAYGELLIDDVHNRGARTPDKLGFQLGLEGVGTAVGRRMTWGAEYTRLTRFVYTSFFGRTFEAQGTPLGFPTGPDARRLRVRIAADLGFDWQLLANAALTDQGENSLEEPYVPGTPEQWPFAFEGVVERTRTAEAGVRWWPASGVDVTLLGGWREIEDAGHVAGATEDGFHAALELRLVR